MQTILLACLLKIFTVECNCNRNWILELVFHRINALIRQLYKKVTLTGSCSNKNNWMWNHWVAESYLNCCCWSDYLEFI